MAYTKQTWENLPSQTTPINADRLTHIEDGIFDAAATADTAASNASSAISGLADKVDKVEGKGLSTNDFTDALQTKLNNIEAGAEVNVQSDWDEADSSSDAFILNKPTLGTSAYKNSTSVVTDSSDLVESGAVKDIVGWGNKNLCNGKATSKTDPYGVTWTVDPTDNNIVTVSGTPTGFQAFRISSDNVLEAGTYRIFGLSDVVNVDFNIIKLTKNDVDVRIIGTGFFEGGTFEILDTDNYDTVIVEYKRKTNNVACSGTIRNMITKVSNTDGTYKPYHASVSDSLAEKADNSVIAPTENGSTASQAYAVGSHAIRNGAFITWKNAKAQGETINDASDYTSGMVGDAIYIEKNHGAQTITAGNFFSEAVTLPSGYDVVMSDIVLARAGVALYAVPKIVCTSNDKNSRTIVVLNSDSNDHTWDIYSHFILKKRN